MANEPTKKIRLATGSDAVLFPAEHDGFACVLGHGINKGQYYGVCPDCGGIFCEACMTNGSFEGHDCEDEDPED